MIVGVIKETKNGEGRVGLTAPSVNALFSAGHKVIVEKGCGIAAGYNDTEYFLSGADIVDTPEEVVLACDILVKVKEPTPEEFRLLDLMKGKILYTFLHLGANRPLANKLCENRITGISYDTVEDEKGNLYMLYPMSDIAGQIAGDTINDLAKAGEIRPVNRVSVVGAGTVGGAAVYRLHTYNPLKIKEVHVYDLDSKKIDLLKQKYSSPYLSSPKIVPHARAISPEEIAASDAIVGAVLVPGAKAPCVIKREHWKNMAPKSLLIDVAIDQGGCIEGARPTSHSNPTYEEDGKVFYCTPNMPGSRPNEASIALNYSTLAPLMSICTIGLEKTCKTMPGFDKGINTLGGKVVNETVLAALEKA